MVLNIILLWNTEKEVRWTLFTLWPKTTFLDFAPIKIRQTKNKVVL